MTDAIETLVRWIPEERAEDALEIARREDKLLFVDLYAPGCKGCDRLDRTTYSEAEVASVLNDQFVPILLNGRRPSAVLETLNGSHGYAFSPVLIFRTPDGVELRRTIGYLSPEAMLLELHMGLAMRQMQSSRWVNAYRVLDQAIHRYVSARNVAEAIWWRGVAAYRKSGNDVGVLQEAWGSLLRDHAGTIWAEKADILSPTCVC